MSPSGRRFRVALSFPGEYRAFAKGVAEYLGNRLGRERVLYDNWYEAEFARLNLDDHLQRLYRDESDLVAVFLCAAYERKRWCRLEWRAIKDLITTARKGSIMLFRFDNSSIPGLFFGDGYVDIRHRSPAQIAELILLRLGDSSVKPTVPRAYSSLGCLYRHAPGKLFGRDRELAVLDAAWNESKTHLLTLVAWGGVGKTSLVAHWMTIRDVWNSHDFERVLDWSFYSQGTRKEGAPSAEQFIDTSLRFFGDPDPSRGSPHDKGQRLARLVGQTRCLLVLDGLEPLQHPPGPLAGKLRDEAVDALLKGLAQRNRGLCVVTTRERLADLTLFLKTTAPVLELENLSTLAGIELLKMLGVQGTAAEFQRLVEDVAGHALTLHLLGAYLVLAHRGDIRKRDLVQLDQANTHVQGGHAFKVMEAYEKWFISGGRDGEQQLAVLRLLGLFDRPADAGCLAALRREPSIPGLTDPLVDLSEAQWNIALARIEECGLISLRQGNSVSGADLVVDAHPLVREYFANKLEKENPIARSQAHARLFEHLISTCPQRRPTLEQMVPLFQALIHGCEARCLREALAVYRQKILGGNVGAARYTLGAFGRQVATLLYFVDPMSRKPASELSAEDGAFVMSQLGFCLRSLTRFKEAQEWMQAALDAYLDLGKWKLACDSAAILCHLCTTTGDLDRALRTAKQSVMLADRSHDPFLQTIMRMTLGNVLHYLGRLHEARRAFSKAQKLKPTLRHEESRLRYTLRLFHYHDFLLTEGETQEVTTGARKALKVQLPGRQSELNQGLHSVSLGLAILLKAQRGLDADLAEAQHYLDNALTYLRNADREDDLPYALTARAELWRLLGDLDGSEADLGEALLITSRAEMNRLAAHCHLSFARLHLTKGEKDKAASSLAETQKLIRAMGYRRLQREFDQVQRLLKSASNAAWLKTRPTRAQSGIRPPGV